MMGGGGMKKRCAFLALIQILTLLLTAGCGARQKLYSATYFDLFDTVTVIRGSARSEAAFSQSAKAIHDELLEYHRLFDIYNDYEGLSNLKTVNDGAGIAPVEVDGRIIRLLQDCKGFYAATDGRVNVAMGSVLQLWHEARSAALDDPSQAAVPGDSALRAAAEHTALDALVIDEAASIVFLSDPALRLDVGAVAKGWAVQRVAEHAPAGFLISVGGNICATGPKNESGAPWVVAIQDPEEPEAYLHTLHLTSGSVVTSGDYQRTYTVDGVSYHHIIDPDTCYPSEYWRSVTVVCADSGAADALSTALFLLPRDRGQTLLEQYDAEALWVGRDGSAAYSPGFRKMIGD